MVEKYEDRHSKILLCGFARSLESREHWHIHYLLKGGITYEQIEVNPSLEVVFVQAAGIKEFDERWTLVREKVRANEVCVMSPAFLLRNLPNNKQVSLS